MNSPHPRTDLLRRRVPLVALWAHECLNLAQDLETKLTGLGNALQSALDFMKASVQQNAALAAENNILRAALQRIESNDPEANRQHADVIANQALGEAAAIRGATSTESFRVSN